MKLFSYLLPLAALATGVPFLNAQPAGVPPPYGFSVIAAAPNADTFGSSYGLHPRMVLDANGDPMVSYFVLDLSSPKDANTSIYFTQWSRSAGKFTNPLKVAVIGDYATGPGADVFQSLARDASNNTLGIAYILFNSDGSSTVLLALSRDNGLTWTTQKVVTMAGSSPHDPSLSLVNGKVYLAYVTDFEGVRYVTGNESDAPSLWSSQLAPVVGSYNHPEHYVSLAVDAAGNPGVAYILGTDASYNRDIVFWRPGSPAATVVGDTNNQPGSFPDVQLAFFGTQPRVVYAGQRDDSDGYGKQIWASASTDSGQTWTPWVGLPSDGQNSLDSPLWLTLGSRGQSALILGSNGGTNVGTVCGNPKISRSSDFVNWTTCGPAPQYQPNFYSAEGVGRFDANDRLMVAFPVQAGGDLTYGLALWREAPAGGLAPRVSPGGVVNAASFVASMAPGSLASIFGSNFGTAGESASAVPLPLTLAGVSVTVNGRLAPLVYANPTQINFQIPYETPVGNASVVVSTVGGGNSVAAIAPIAAAAPGIFVYDANRAIVQNNDYSLNGISSGAKAGSAIVAYLTGSGAVTNPVPSGFAAPPSPLSYVMASPITATIGDQPAQVVFAGLTPGFVGLLQMNIVVPPTLLPGDYPLVVTLGGVKSNGPLVTVVR